MAFPRKIPRALLRVSAVGAAALAAAAAAFLLFVHRPVERFLADIRAGRTSRVSVVGRGRVSPPPDGWSLIPPRCDASAAAWFEGRYYVAAATGGLLLYDARFSFRGRIGSLEGLPENRLTSLAVFGGSLWIGTASEGLVRLSRGELVRYRSRDAAGDRVTCLATGPADLFAGTFGGGVLRFDGVGFRLVPGTRGLAVSSLAAGPAGLAVGTQDRGLLVVRGASVQTVSGMGPGPVTALDAVSDGFLAASPAGAWRVDAGGRARAIMEERFCTAVASAGGPPLVGTLADGLFECGSGAPVRVAGMEGIRAVRTVAGRLFVLASGGAFVRRETGFERLPDPGTLPGGPVTALAFDGSGRLWAGTFENGIVVLDGEVPVRVFDDEPAREVNCLALDRTRGTMLAGTNAGLLVFDAPGSYRTIGFGDGLAGEIVSGIAFSGDRVYCALADGGLSWIDAGGIASLTRFQGLVNNHVYSCAVWGSRVYAGTLGGVSVVENGRVAERFTAADSGLPANWVSALCAGSDALFAGTYGGGLCRLAADGRWRPYRAAGSFEVNTGALMLLDGRLLAGTLARGIVVLDTAGDACVNIRDRLPSANVSSLAVDGRFLYAGTECGILRISRDALEGLLP